MEGTPVRRKELWHGVGTRRPLGIRLPLKAGHVQSPAPQGRLKVEGGKDQQRWRDSRRTLRYGPQSRQDAPGAGATTICPLTA